MTLPTDDDILKALKDAQKKGKLSVLSAVLGVSGKNLRKALRDKNLSCLSQTERTILTGSLL